jgi:hypothetical protein
MYDIETGNGLLQAKRAVNCLVEPEPGDLALLSLDPFGRAYILSILDREGEGNVSLSFAKDVDFKVNNGRLRACAQEGVEMVSGKDLNLVAGEISVNAVAGEINVERLSYFGRLVESQVERIKLWGEACDSVFDRVTQRVQNSFRRVAELDQVDAGSMNYLAKKLMSLRGKYSVMTASKDVRIDGDKIIMG